MLPNGLQYDQWRNAVDITVRRYKRQSGADAFQLPLRPPLVILRVELNPASRASSYKNTRFFPLLRNYSPK
jgi:hypothetical protein